MAVDSTLLSESSKERHQSPQTATVFHHLVAFRRYLRHIRRAASLTCWARHGCGCSSGVEHDLAKVGVEGSNPFARSNIFKRNLGAFGACPIRRLAQGLVDARLPAGSGGAIAAEHIRSKRRLVAYLGTSRPRAA